MPMYSESEPAAQVPLPGVGVPVEMGATAMVPVAEGSVVLEDGSGVPEGSVGGYGVGGCVSRRWHSDTPGA